MNAKTTGAGWCRRRTFLAGAMAWPLAGKAEDQPPVLDGRSIELHVTTVAPCRASQIAAEMAPLFTQFAKSERHYDATLVFSDSNALPGKAWPADVHLVIAPTPLLSVLAAPKWIAPLNTLIQIRPALDVAWFAPVVRESFQLFPETSANRYAIPQSGDALVLFVRRDLTESDVERAAFRKMTGQELPSSFEAFEALTWPALRTLLGFFHRPDAGLAGWIAPLQGDLDGFAAAALSVLLSSGGRLWDPATGQIEGVLNTRANGLAMADYLSLAAYQPEGAAKWTASEAIAHFAAGHTFAALQWASAGPELIPPALAGKVMAVPLPGVAAPDGALLRRSPVGGRLWAVNAATDAEHQQAAADLLDWWCRPETCAEFARRGGLPCDKATLSSPDFDASQPWHRAYKTMLAAAVDLWRDPRYGDLLTAQQEMLAAVAGGQDVMGALQRLACRQQGMLFDEGSAERRPGVECREN